MQHPSINLWTNAHLLELCRSKNRTSKHWEPLSSSELLHIELTKNSGKSLGFDQFLRAKELRTKVKCLYDLLAKNPLVLGRMCPFSSDNCFQARNEKLLSSYLLCLGRVALLVSHRVCMCLPHRLKFTVYLILTKQLSHIASYCTICGGTQQDLHGNGMFNHLDTTSNPTKETIAQLQVWTTVRVVVTSGLLGHARSVRRWYLCENESWMLRLYFCTFSHAYDLKFGACY